MKGHLTGIGREDNGGTCTMTVWLPPDRLDELSELVGTSVDIEIKRWRNPRSKDANRYCWKLIDCLAEKLCRSRTEIYREAIRDIGGVSETYCVRDKAVQTLIDGWQRDGVGWFADQEPSAVYPGFVNVTLYKGSSAYDSKQMHALIDHIVQDCKAVGIETLTPNELAAMEAAWKEARP